MNKFLITTLLVFGLSSTSAYAQKDLDEEPVAKKAEKAETKKSEEDLICRRVRVTGSNRTEKVCRRASKSKSNSDKPERN